MNNYKKVYVCSPLHADTEDGIRENVENAKVYMKVVSEALGCKAIAPHAYLAEILDDNVSGERLLALEFGIKFLSLCDALVYVGDNVSSGMKAEIEMAERLKMPIFKANIFNLDKCVILRGVDRFAR